MNSDSKNKLCSEIIQCERFIKLFTCLLVHRMQCENCSIMVFKKNFPVCNNKLKCNDIYSIKTSCLFNFTGKERNTAPMFDLIVQVLEITPLSNIGCVIHNTLPMNNLVSHSHITSYFDIYIISIQFMLNLFLLISFNQTVIAVIKYIFEKDNKMSLNYYLYTQTC